MSATIVVVTGVAASGKTLIGRLLASDLHWSFIDADDVHPAENVAKMAAGIPLTDADREPWLTSLHELLLDADRAGRNTVLACSALRRDFRERLRAGIDGVRFIYLRAPVDLVTGRARARRGHYFQPELVQSQFEALEEPEDALIVDAAGDPADIVRTIANELAV